MKLIGLYIAIFFVFLTGCSKKPQDYFEEGIKKYNAGYIKEAAKLFNKTIQIEPENVKARFFIGMCYKKTGKIDKAIEKLHYAYEVSPEDFFILYNLADCYLMSENFEQSLLFARKSLRIKPDFMESHLVLGISLMKAKRLAEARSELSFIVKVIQDNGSPVKKEAMLYLAQLYRETDKLKESKELLEALCKENKMSPEYNYSLGLTYIALNNSAKARKQVEILRELKNPLADALANKISR